MQEQYETWSVNNEANESRVRLLLCGSERVCSGVSRYFQQRAERDVVRPIFTQNSCLPNDHQPVPDDCPHCCGAARPLLPHQLLVHLLLVVEEEVGKKNWNNLPRSVAAVGM